ncbi:hypothetical protein JCM33374_g2478 [Metschnikowia sp. JCM 33374]|nr:hypothetical protein JCM33374_g2478 [Metschnikowia sp. JCM 33374]
MFSLGICQPKAKVVTGTVVMMDDVNSHGLRDNGTKKTHSDDPDNDKDSRYQSNESHGWTPLEKEPQLKKHHTGIILHPQPEDDPNDPLNWPLIRKDLCFLIIGFQTFLGGGQTPLLAAGFHKLSVEFGKSPAVISYLVGAVMLALGVGSVFASPTAILYGKRLVYLLGIVLFFIGAIVCASAKDYGALMAGRILTGLGASPTESLASASLSELYFQHERAYRTGLYTLLLLGGKNILPLLSSLVFQHLNRHWLFWIQSMFLGANLVLTFLFVPETYWDRSSTPSSFSSSSSSSSPTKESGRTSSHSLGSNGYGVHRHDETRTPKPESTSTGSLTSSHDSHVSEPLGNNKNTTIPLAASLSRDGSTSPRTAINDDAATSTSVPKNFIHRLHVISGRHSADKWWMVALRPVYLYTYPSVLYGSLVYSLAVVWLIVISEVLSETFRAKPYGFSAQTIGLFYVSPFVGGILGSLFAGIIGDYITRIVVRRNHGVYEPEFRLLMLVPSTLFTCMGLMGYGWSAQEKDPWIAPVIFFGCLSFGSSMASTTAITYTIDCYKMFAAEALVSFNFAKNIIGFVFSLFNNDAYAAIHGKKLFVIYGCAQLVISLLGIVVYVFGKVFRSWTDEKQILKSLYHADKFISETK